MTHNPFEDLLGNLFRGPVDPMVPIKDDPKAEAKRLAREWRKLSDRMKALWPDDEAGA